MMTSAAKVGREILFPLLAVLNVLVTFTPTVTAEEKPEQVMYVTGCLGSNAVTLHAAASSDDIRAVFVYKGSEILGSDIIPAQGNYKGRLKINREGEVILSNLRLGDSGVFRVEMARRDSKTSTYVVLVVPETPMAHDDKLYIQTTNSPDKPDHVRLTCGKFTSLGYPPAAVLWQDPEGRLLYSSGHRDGYFFLDIRDTSPSGNYTCFLHCDTPHSCCTLLHDVPVHVAINLTSSMTSEVTPEMTSVLRKTGEDMALGMAALVNDQVQETFQTNQEQFDRWKEEMEHKMEHRLKNIRTEFESLLQANLEGAGGGEDNEYSSEVESRLRLIQQEIDKGNKNVNNFQESLNAQIAVFQKKLKAIRQNVKKHGLSSHRKMIHRLADQMKKKIEEIDEKLSNWSSADDDIANTLQLVIKEIEDKADQDKTSVENFVENMTNKIEDMQKKMAAMEEQLQRHEAKLQMSEAEEDNAESDDTVNDTKSRVGRINKQTSPERTDDQNYEATAYFAGQREDPPVKFNISVSGSCKEAKQKGGTWNGAYSLQPDGLDTQRFWCDMERAGGGWLVFQRRQDGSEEFYRPWKDYVEGFGDPSSGGEFWLGLDKLHQISSSRPHSLRVDLRTFDGVEGYAYYRHFCVLSAHQNYLMDVHGYSGTSGDSLIVHDSKAFSTWDEDHDDWGDGHCAQNYRSAWWYARCRIADLNAPYNQGPDGIMWLYGDDAWGAGKIAFVEMKIRPV